MILTPSQTSGQVICLACLGASMWMSGVAEAGSPLEIEVAPECADAQQIEILQDELEVRLEEVAQTVGWRLSWRMEAGRCELALQDAEIVMVIPLEGSASEESLRNAAMRLAWVMTMEAPKPVVVAEKSPEEPAEALRLDGNLKPPLTWLDRAFVSLDAQALMSPEAPVALLGGRVGMAFGERWRLSLGLYGSVGQTEEVNTGGSGQGRTVVDNSVFVSRLGADVNLWSWSIVDMGLYSAVGAGWGGPLPTEGRRGGGRGSDNPNQGGDSALFAEAGAQLQLALSPRLSLEGSVGRRWAKGPSEALSDQLSGEIYSLGVRLYWGEVLGDR